jgi:hypothetical protein
VDSKNRSLVNHWEQNQRPTDAAAEQAIVRRNMPVHPRVQAIVQAGRYQGIELDPNEFRYVQDEAPPSAAALSLWAQNAGLWSRAVRIRWRHLLRF